MSQHEPAGALFYISIWTAERSTPCYGIFFYYFIVVNKAKMLSAGVAEEVLKFLKSEMPPVQFKLLGTLRMLIDAQGKSALWRRLRFIHALFEWP